MRNADNISYWIYIILGLVPLIILVGAHDYFYQPKIGLVYIVLTLMVGTHYNSENRARLGVDGISKTLLAYWLLLVLTSLTSIDITRSVLGSIHRSEGLIAISSYLLLFIFSRTYFSYHKKYINWLILSAVLVCLYGILQYYGYDPIPRDPIRVNWTGRAFSTMGNPNFLGTYTVLMLPLPLLLYIRERKPYFLLASLVIYLCLLLTLTRSAIMGFVVIWVSLLVFALRQRAYLARFMVATLLLGLVTVYANGESEGRIYGRFSSIGEDAQRVASREEGYERAGANRFYIWVGTAELIGERPLTGYGLESLGRVFTERYSDDMREEFGRVYLFDRAHNEYLHIAVSTGIPSLLLYFLFLLLCLRKGASLLRLDERRLPFYIAVLAYLVQAFFNISVVAVAYIFWIFLGLVTSQSAFELDESS